MKILGVSKSGARQPDFTAVTGPADLENTLTASHYVLIATPLTTETRGLLGVKEFVAMRDDGVLLNAARGPVVDTNEMIDALMLSWLFNRAAAAVEPQADSEPHLLGNQANLERD
jgi:D-2-hydroxyacid dehydrogenase (NADP+)